MLSPNNVEELRITVDRNRIVPDTIGSDHENQRLDKNNETIENNIISKKTLKQKLYNIWKGQNRFYCWGRLIHGPQLNGFVVISIIKMVVSGIFFGLVTPYLWKHEIYYLPIVVIVLLIITVLFMFLAACIDPGIIPRKEIIDIINEKNSLDCFIKTENEQKDKNLNYNFCGTCNIFRPPLCSHCL